MGLFSAIAGIFGGGSQKKAAREAAAAQTAALNRAIDIQNQQYQQTRQDYMPYTTAGGKAIVSLDQLINGGMTSDQITQMVKGNPLYGAMHDAGQESLLQNAAATGGLRGGNNVSNLANFDANTLASVYGTIKSDLSGLAGLGLGATGSVAGFGANTADNVGNLTTEIGNAQANKQLAIGRINSQNWSNIGSFLDDAISAAMPTNFMGLSRAAVARLNPAAQSVIASNPKIF